MSNTQNNNLKEAIEQLARNLSLGVDGLLTKAGLNKPQWRNYLESNGAHRVRKKTIDKLVQNLRNAGCNVLASDYKRLYEAIEVTVEPEASVNNLASRENPQSVRQNSLELKEAASSYVEAILHVLDSKYGAYLKFSLPKTIEGQRIDLKRLRTELEATTRVKSLFDPEFFIEIQKPAYDQNGTQITIEEGLLKHNRIVLLGAPGAGKSTSLHRLFWLFSQFWLQENSVYKAEKIVEAIPPEFRERIPIFVELNTWVNNSPNALENYLKNEISKYDTTGVLEREFLNLVKEGQILLLLDGTNELPELKKDKNNGLLKDHRVLEINSIDQLTRWSRTLAVLSCRENTFKGGVGWQLLHAQPLTPDQILEFAHEYFQNEERATQFENSLYGEKVGRNDGVQYLASIPFYLQRLVEFFYVTNDLTDNKTELIKFSIDQALPREYVPDVPRPTTMTQSEALELQNKLALLAFNMTDAGKVGTVGISLASAWLYRLRQKKDFWDRNYAEPQIEFELIKEARHWFELAENAGLLFVSNDTVVFYHQLIQEYFCATYLNSNLIDSELLQRVAYGYFNQERQHQASLDPLLGDKLLSLLQNSENEEIRAAAAVNLGMLKNKKYTQHLIKALNDKEGGVRSRAADGLAINGDDQAVLPLIDRLKDNDWDVRYSAAMALIQFPDERAIVPLIVGLFIQGNSDVNYAIMGALIKQGKSAIMPLLNVLFNRKAFNEYTRYVEARLYSVKVLSVIGDEETIPFLRILAEKDRGIVWWGDKISDAAINAINKIEGKIKSISGNKPI